MGWIESRIQVAEQRLESIYRRLLDVEKKVKQALQQVQGAYQSGGGGGSSSPSGAAFVCMCPSAVSGSWSGTAPTAPGSFTAEVFQLQSGSYTSLGIKTVYNAMPSATVSGKACNLVPDGQGNYMVVSQSCV